MVAVAELERTARQVYEQEWTQWSASPSLQLCPVPWLLRDLLGMLAQMHDQPVAKLEPMIRQLIVDHAFIDEQGDPTRDAVRRRAIDAHVRLLMRVVTEVRRTAEAEGEWSNIPAPPLMCG